MPGARRVRRTDESSAVEGPDHGASRTAWSSPTARPRPPQADGRDGAAGLRPVRLQLRRLFQGDLRAGRAAAQSLRARRQGHRPHAEDRSSRRWAAASSAPRRSPPRPPRRRRRRATAGAGYSRDHPVDGTLPQRTRLNGAGLGEGDLPYRDRSLRIAGSITRSATASASSRPTIRRSPMRSSRRSMCRRTFPIGGEPFRAGADRGHVARRGARHAVPVHLVSDRRRAAAEGQGAGDGRGSGRRCRRRSTCSPRSRSSPASGPTPKP